MNPQKSRLPHHSAKQRRGQPPPPLARLRGYALAIAIFVLVALAVLAVMIANISSSQQIGLAQDLEGAYAQQAARAGLEWGMYQVQATPAYNFGYLSPAVAVNSANPNTRACPSSPASFSPPAETLAKFTVTVSCEAITDGNNGPTVFRLIAVACNRPNAGACPGTAGPLYVERRLEARL